MDELSIGQLRDLRQLTHLSWLTQFSRLTRLGQHVCFALVVCLISMSGSPQVSHARKRKRKRPRAQTVVVFPFSAPHLNRATLNKQSTLMRRALARRRLIKVRSARSTKRAIKRSRFNLSMLNDPREARASVSLVCDRARVNHAISAHMVLGVEDKPALLKGVWFFCENDERRIERFELPFEGRLNKRAWRLFAELAEEALQRPAPLSSAPLAGHDSRLDHPREGRPPRGRPIAPPPLTPMNPPINPTGVSSPEITPQLASPGELKRGQGAGAVKSTRSEINAPQPHLELWAGSRLFVRDFLYNTSPESALLRGGIRYSSGLLPGWGLSARLRPLHSHARSALRQIMISADLERYRFNSIYVIADPFGADSEERLASELTRWGLGVSFGHGIESGARLHTIGLEFKYRGLAMALEDNPHYLGVNYHSVELGLVSALSLIPGALWFDLSGSFAPWVGLGDSVTEVGAESQTLGAGARMALRYRMSSGLSLAMRLGLDFIFYDVEGEGRSGRIGDEARDQIITLSVDAGWVSLSADAPQIKLDTLNSAAP